MDLITYIVGMPISHPLFIFMAGALFGAWMERQVKAITLLLIAITLAGMGAHYSGLFGYLSDTLKAQGQYYEQHDPKQRELHGRDDTHPPAPAPVSPISDIYPH